MISPRSLITRGVTLGLVMWLLTSLIVQAESSAVMLIDVLHKTAREQQPPTEGARNEIARLCWATRFTMNKTGLESEDSKLFYSPQTLEDIQAISRQCRQGLGRYHDPRIDLTSLLNNVALKTAVPPESYHRLMMTLVFIFKTLQEDELALVKAMAEYKTQEGPDEYTFTSTLPHVGWAGPRRISEGKYLPAGVAICQDGQERVFKSLWESTLPNTNLSSHDSRNQYLVSLGMEDSVVRHHYRNLSKAVKDISDLISQTRKPPAKPGT